MIGSLVNYFYGEHPDSLCVIVSEYGKEFSHLHDNEDGYEDEEDTLFLIYDLKHKEYFYAMLYELSFVYS